MEIRITKLDSETHRAAKIIAAHRGQKLNEFYTGAIKDAVKKEVGADPTIAAVVQKRTRKK